MLGLMLGSNKVVLSTLRDFAIGVLGSHTPSRLPHQHCQAHSGSGRSDSSLHRVYLFIKHPSLRRLLCAAFCIFIITWRISPYRIIVLLYIY